MAEYIEREALLDMIAEKLIDTCNGKLSCLQVWRMLKSIPTADVAEVRHGEWLDVMETDLYVPDYKTTITQTAETCSACKVRIGFTGAKLYLFDAICPNCGARMDGGADNG